MSRRVSLAAAFCTLVLSTPRPCVALDELFVRFSYHTWTHRDGLASSDITTVAQDAMGYLWVATAADLMRFDGVRFIRWGLDGSSLPNVRVLLFTHDGALWLGFGSGGVARLRNGEIERHASSVDGLFDTYVTAMLERRDRSVWVGGQGGLAQFDGTRWRRIGPDEGLPAHTVYALHEDDRGRLWVGTSIGVFRREGGRPFERMAALPHRVDDFEDGADGSLWVTHPTRGVQRIVGDTIVDVPLTTQAHGMSLLRDRQGVLWIGTQGEGLFRVSGHGGVSQPIVERLTRSEGLPSEIAQSLFEDEEGSIWVGTRMGLSRISRNLITPVARLEDGPGEYVRTITTTHDGAVWAGTASGLYRFLGGRIRRFGRRDGLPSEFITSLHHDARTQTFWVGTDRGLARFGGTRFAAWSPPDGVSLTRVDAMTTDTRGRLWLCDFDRGVFRSRDGSLKAFDVIAERMPASAVYTDRMGRVWIGYTNGAVDRFSPGDVRETFSGSHGLAGGYVFSVYEDHAGAIWVSSRDGLTRFTQDRVLTLRSGVSFPGQRPVAIAGEHDGHIWLGTGAGVVRLPAAEFERAARDSSYRPTYRLYDESDGLPGVPVWNSFPAAVRAGDGAFWFVTAGGLAVADLNRSPFSFDDKAVPAVIERLVVNDHDLGFASGTRLRQTARLHVDYTALSLAAPSKIRFRYKLEGFDPDWIEAGAHRQAVYTNLQPGSYRFRVAAMTADRWSEANEPLAFLIEPFFYQTRWFALTGALAVGLLVWVVWQLRIRQVHKEFALVLDERTRIARELHDTLLQGFVGVALQCTAVSQLLETSPETAKDRLERIRSRVEHYIREARESIWDLRSSGRPNSDFVDTLRSACELILSGRKDLRLDFSVVGRPFRCTRQVEEQLLRVGQEALMNAVKHADASHVQVALVYATKSVHLKVSDDGRGFDPAGVPSAAGRHWGLTNMRERVEQINGHLTLASTEGRGTRLEVIVPVLSTH